MKIGVIGHRPHRLGSADDASWARIQLNSYLQNHYDGSPVHIAIDPGIGMSAARFLKFRGSRYTLVIPVYDWGSRWPHASQNMLSHYSAGSHDLICVCVGNYGAYKVHLRNRYIVDKCDYLCIVWNRKEGGGTYEAMKYALSLEGKRIILICPQTREFITINTPSIQIDDLVLQPVIPIEEQVIQFVDQVNAPW